MEGNQVSGGVERSPIWVARIIRKKGGPDLEFPATRELSKQQKKTKGGGKEKEKRAANRAHELFP